MTAADVPDVGGDRLRVSPADVSRHGPTEALLLSVLRYPDAVWSSPWMRFTPSMFAYRTGLSIEDIKVAILRLTLRGVLDHRTRDRDDGPPIVEYRFSTAAAVETLEATPAPIGPPVNDWTARFEAAVETESEE